MEINEKAIQKIREDFDKMIDDLNEDKIEMFKKGGKNKNWIQKATASIKKRGTEGVCTGSKFGGPTCRPGTRRYNLAVTFKKMGKKKD